MRENPFPIGSTRARRWEALMSFNVRAIEDLARKLQLRRGQTESLGAFIARLVRQEEEVTAQQAREEEAAKASAKASEETVLVRLSKADWEYLQTIKFFRAEEVFKRARVVTGAEAKIVTYVVNADLSELKKSIEEFKNDFKGLFGE